MSLVKKIFNYIWLLIEQDGLYWGILNILKKIIIILRSKFAAIALNAPKLYLGDTFIIRGVKYISFGKSIHINGRVWLEAVTQHNGIKYKPNIVIGDRAAFSHDVHISAIEHITIGDDVLLGSRVYISDHGHGNYKGVAQSSPDLAPAQRPLGGGGHIHIDKNVWIGDNVVIVGPVHIGHGVIIGANSVVRHNIPPLCIAAGAPAKIIKKYDENLAQWILV